MLVELGLGGCDSSGEIVVIECWIDDFVAVIFQVGRLDAAWDRVPAVEEENRGHDNSASCRASEISMSLAACPHSLA